LKELTLQNAAIYFKKSTNQKAVLKHFSLEEIDRLKGSIDEIYTEIKEADERTKAILEEREKALIEARAILGKVALNLDNSALEDLLQPKGRNKLKQKKEYAKRQTTAASGEFTSLGEPRIMANDWAYFAFDKKGNFSMCRRIGRVNHVFQREMLSRENVAKDDYRKAVDIFALKEKFTLNREFTIDDKHFKREDWKTYFPKTPHPFDEVKKKTPAKKAGAKKKK